MHRPLAILAAAVLLTACGSTSTASLSDEPSPAASSHAGHGADRSETPGASHPVTPPEADGSIVLENDFATGGSGVDVAEALEVASSMPVLVRGVLLRDAEGGTWICEAIDDATPPGCDSPRLWVIDLPDDAAVFDPANAEDVGARTEDGVTWVEEQLLFGVVHPVS